VVVVLAPRVVDAPKKMAWTNFVSTSKITNFVSTSFFSSFQNLGCVSIPEFRLNFKNRFSFHFRSWVAFPVQGLNDRTWEWTSPLGTSFHKEFSIGFSGPGLRHRSRRRRGRRCREAGPRILANEGIRFGARSRKPRGSIL
jgi:hypothetical protein